MNLKDVAEQANAIMEEFAKLMREKGAVVRGPERKRLLVDTNGKPISAGFSGIFNVKVWWGPDKERCTDVISDGKVCEAPCEKTSPDERAAFHAALEWAYIWYRTRLKGLGKWKQKV